MGYDTGGTGKLQMIISNNTTALNAAGSGLTSTLTNMYADNTWQVISLTKQGTLFKAWINGIEVLSGNVTNTSFANKDLYIGNQVGWGATSTDFASTYQGQFYLDHLFPEESLCCSFCSYRHHCIAYCWSVCREF